MAVDFKGLAGGYRKFLLNYKIDWESIRDLSDQYIFWACPFDVILGAIDATETGLKPLFADPSDYTQFSRVFNAKGTILANWTDSYTIADNSKDPYKGTPEKHYYDNHGLKTFKVGRSYKGVVLKEGTDDQFIPSAGNKGYTQQTVTKSVTIRFYNIEANAKMFSDLTSGILNLNFYILPNFNISRQRKELSWSAKRKKNPFYDECRTFFYSDIESTTLGYADYNEIGFIEMTFYSIDSRIAKSGISINTYLQMGGPGEPFAFPLLTDENEIVLDPARAQPVPVTHAQIQILGMSGTNSIQFIGRPVYYSMLSPKVIPYVIYPPCTLNFYNLRKSVNNLVSLKAYPTDNYFWVKNFKLDLVKEYVFTKSFNAYYNPFQPKSTGAYILTNNSATTSTNTGNNVYYDKHFLETSTVWGSANLDWDVNGNSYFLYKDEDGNAYSTLSLGTTATTFYFSKCLPTSGSAYVNGLAQFFMFNAYLEKTQIQLPLQFTDLTMVDFIHLPVAGSLFRALTFGLVGNGWSTSDIVRPAYPYFNCIIPQSVYKAYSNLFVDTLSALKTKTVSHPAGTLPFGVFYKGMDDGIGIITGANAITQSYCGSLTHMVNMSLVSDKRRLLTDKNLATSEIQNNVYPFLASGEKWIRPLISEATNIMPSNASNDNPLYKSISTTQPDPIMGYTIDFFELNHFSKADYQIKFFSVEGWNPASLNEVKDEDCVWIGTYKSQAETTGNIRLFRNYGLLSDPTFKWKTSFHYPQDLQPPPPASSKFKTKFVSFEMKNNTTLINVNTASEDSAWLWNPLTSPTNFISDKTIPVIPNYTLQNVKFSKLTLLLTVHQPLKIGNQVLNPIPTGTEIELNDVVFVPTTSALPKKYIAEFKGFDKVIFQEQDVPISQGATWIYIQLASWNGLIPTNPAEPYALAYKYPVGTKQYLKLSFELYLIKKTGEASYEMSVKLVEIMDINDNPIPLYGISTKFKGNWEFNSRTFNYHVYAKLNGGLGTSDQGIATYIENT